MCKTIYPVLTSLVSVLYLPCLSSLAASSIVNGDFETGDFLGWTSSGTVLVSSDVGYRTHAGGIGNWPRGTYVAAFGGGDVPDTGIITQTIPTTPNDDYLLTFDYGAFGRSAQSMSIQVKDGDSLSVLNTLSIFDSTATFVMNNVFDPYQMMFRATGDRAIISFASTSSYTVSSDGLLDNVVVNPVPAPAAVVLGGIGIGLVNWLRRRRTI